MANLGLIDFKLGLYIKVNVNDRQNKFEVHISNNLAKIAINWQNLNFYHTCSEIFKMFKYRNPISIF